MTDPPPPPEAHPPPSPPPGYPTPPQAGPAFAPAAGTGLPPDAYTPWSARALAWLIDYIGVFLILGVGFAVLAATRETICVTDTSEFDLGEFCATGASRVGQLSALVVAPLIALAYVVFNLGYRQGTTGSSIGKSRMNFKVVDEKTGQPIGFGLSLVRELVYVLLYGACGILWLVAVLFPLWDPKRQTLVDKLFGTICLPL